MTNLKQLLFLFIILITLQLQAQDVGRVVIKNASDNFPKFIVSLNGIRASNDYNSSATYDFLDEYNYKINILQAGSRTTLSFMVYSAPNFISTYVIDKDKYGNYLFSLASKVLMVDSTAGASKPSSTAVAGKTAAVATGTVIEEGEYFEIVKTLKKEANEKNRLDLSMTFFADKWFLASMVKDALKMFGQEKSRVTFAKFAYPRTVDKKNYFKVFDSLTLSNSKKEMNEFIKANP
ncbi:MAG: DUF4476 domain-containing protein [bacterium]|nr:DUF4476 domain-containing protein [bacterium]